MDLLRSTIKSLLYDFPLEEIVEHLAYKKSHIRRETGEKPFEGELFYELTSEFMSWREQGFSSTETRLLNNILSEEWLVDEKYNFPVDPIYHPYERVILLLEKCGMELLEIVGDNPLVKFEQLLRWRELTLLIGEDTLILPVLASNDLYHNKQRFSFLWPNTLDHNEVRLNAILDDTLSDTHFHLNAGCDVFEFNWLTVMNNPDVLDHIPNNFLHTGSRRVYDRVNRFYKLHIDLRTWILIACELRLRLYIALKEDNPAELLNMDFNRLDEGRNLSIERLRIKLDRCKRSGCQTSNGFVFDYAISSDNTSRLSERQYANVYMAHHGERYMLYTFMKKYFSGGEDKWRRSASMIYLYILIKNKIRRELIQNNSLRGFENFQIYQSYKDVFLKGENIRKTDSEEERRRKRVGSDRSYKIRETAYRYAVQSALGERHAHYLEARVTPGSLKLHHKMDFGISIYGNQQVLSDEEKKKVTLVAHFIKETEKVIIKSKMDRSLRYSSSRKKWFDEIEKHLLPYLGTTEKGNFPLLTGIDAASNELGCRPEVFGPVFRRAREKGIKHLTYHVGEDFYDIADGLRAIEEAIEYLGMRNGDRLGHCIAMGINARKYYAKRHRYVILPKQELLDNVVWMRFQAMQLNVELQPRTQLFIASQMENLAEELGYAPDFSEIRYWESMRLRGENPIERKTPAKGDSKIVERLLDIYWYNGETRYKGSEIRSVKLPQSYVEDIEKLQEGLLNKVRNKGIFIETNPTSNLQIGGFNRYLELPLFKFHSPNIGNWQLPVSINTDDKGVFSTSLRNEYSLIAAAMWKALDESGNRLYSDKMIIDYLKQIAEYGNLSRFR